jgi:hypothetical protein
MYVGGFGPAVSCPPTPDATAWITHRPAEPAPGSSYPLGGQRRSLTGSPSQLIHGLPRRPGTHLAALPSLAGRTSRAALRRLAMHAPVRRRTPRFSRDGLPECSSLLSSATGSGRLREPAGPIPASTPSDAHVARRRNASLSDDSAAGQGLWTPNEVDLRLPGTTMHVSGGTASGRPGLETGSPSPARPEADVNGWPQTGVAH